MPKDHNTVTNICRKHCITRACLTGLLFFGGLVQLAAQRDDRIPEEYARYMTGFRMDWGIPVQTFGRNLAQQGIGIGGEFLYNVQAGQPLWAGAGVSSYRFDEYSLLYSQEFEGIIYTYRERTATRMFAAHGVVRFQPRTPWSISPYAQGSAGVHWIFTNTRIKDIDVGEVVDRNNQSRESALGFALHGGVHYIPRGADFVRADFRIGYYRNASVRYLRYREGLGGTAGFPIDYFEPRTSSVDMVSIHLGFALMIRGYERVR